MKIKLEYIWLDGYKPEPLLRSKTRIEDVKGNVESRSSIFKFCPEWSFDGSSTRQAEGNFSDCILKPVRCYEDPMSSGNIPSFLVLCEVMNPDGTPHESNARSLMGKEDNNIWFGYEQEYTILKDGKPLGFPVNGYPSPQGKYYCGAGFGRVEGRDFVERHLDLCINAGIDVTGINAEVLLGQWEYQVLGKGKKRAADDLWISRYILHRLSENYGYEIEFHPKPVEGDWNGSGLHCNFSNYHMREVGGEEYFHQIFKTFKERHRIHIENYGSDNHLRLTGNHETQSIDKFTWGVSDRGSSIRIPQSTSRDWKGYLEDRRPASNADPYKIGRVISESLYASEKRRLLQSN